MATNVGFLKSASVSLANGSKTVNITGDVDASHVVSGTAVFIDGALFEGVSGTSPNAGASTITLREDYTGTNITGGAMVVFNTIEGLRDAIRNARIISDDVKILQTAYGDVLTGITPTVSIEIDGVATDVVPYGYLVAQISDLTMVTYQDEPTSTIVRTSRITEFNCTDVADKVYTLDASTFSVGDKVIARKLFDDTGVIELLLDTEIIAAPDRTTTASVTLGGSTALVITIHKVSATDWVSSVAQ